MSKEALQEERINVEPRVVVVSSVEEAEKHKFFGSPTIRIDGKDINPMAEMATRCGLGTCRPYFWEGKMSDYPPKEMILEAIRKQSRFCRAIPKKSLEKAR